MPLPDYAIDRVTTGQFTVIDGAVTRLWDVEFAVDGPARRACSARANRLCAERAKSSGDWQGESENARAESRRARNRSEAGALAGEAGAKELSPRSQPTGLNNASVSRRLSTSN